MKQNKVTFNIFRFRPGTPEPPRFQKFQVTVNKSMSVLDCIEKIRLDQDPTLMFRHSCHHASCGTCACRINGTEMLTCTTRVADLDSNQVDLEPLANFELVGDIAVNIRPFFKEFSKDWRHVRTSGRIQSAGDPKASDRLMRFDNCIECGACYSSCPVVRRNASFLGPAVLAATHNEFLKTGEKDLLFAATSVRGERLCERAINCSHVCPSGVQPARHIFELRRLIQADGDK